MKFKCGDLIHPNGNKDYDGYPAIFTKFPIEFLTNKHKSRITHRINNPLGLIISTNIIVNDPLTRSTSNYIVLFGTQLVIIRTPFLELEYQCLLTE